MFAKIVGFAICGFSVACSAGQEMPAARSAGLESCNGGSVRGDAELARYAACETVHGGLRISGVSTLGPLSRVRSVDGTLAIGHSNELHSLTGLERLEAVSALALVDNTNLSDISQLSHLRTTTSIAIVKSPALRTLDGLSGVAELDRLTVRETGLYTLHGIGNLKHVGVLEIQTNPMLINIGALNGLADASELTVERNPRLCAQLGFFDGLQRTPHVTLAGNTGLSRSELARFEARQTQRAIASR